MVTLRSLPWTLLVGLVLSPSSGWARSLQKTPPSPAAAHSVLDGAARRKASATRHTRKATAPRRAHRRHRRRRYRFIHLANAPGLHVRTPRRAWGTPLTITRLREIFAAYHAEFPKAEPVWIHDMSHERGGKLKPHISHRDGRDVDIRLVLNRPSKYYVRARPRTLDLERTWFILKKLVDTGDVQHIFLDKRLQRALDRYALEHGATPEQLRDIFQVPWRRGGKPVIRHWPGHDDHMHVRFKRKKLTPPIV